MKRFFLVAGLIFQMVTARTVQAEQMSTGDFLKSCGNTDSIDPKQMPTFKLLEYLKCAAYIDGVTDGLVIATTMGDGKKMFCLPPSGLPVGGSIKMIRDYVISKKVPNDQPVRGIVLAAYGSYFPCR
jgi:hypothetical protein